MPKITILPQGLTQEVAAGTNLHHALQQMGCFVDAPCGGRGKCGKCTVLVNGVPMPACRTAINEDMAVQLPQTRNMQTVDGLDGSVTVGKTGFALAFDIGTTTVAGWLLDGRSGAVLASESRLNPQASFGADVISRIQAALSGSMDDLQRGIRDSLIEMTGHLCAQAQIGPERIEVVAVVGNCCMQQLFLGILPENLARIPYAPVLTRAEVIPAVTCLPLCTNAHMLVVPDIGGFVGADTVGCVLATQMQEQEQITLLVDIGTNGEMVLGDRHRMIACSTAAGPALEGANIRFGMRAVAGAIDHVWLQEGALRCSVIGGGPARGICGSGLIDAVAVGLQLGRLNKRGRICNEERVLHLTQDVYLTQDDIRQVQLAKGAIHAGILLMCRKLGITITDIKQVLLAGAFGSFMDPANACLMGLLPRECAGRITAVGNAAGTGAKMLACDPSLLQQAQALTQHIEFLELGSLPEFAKAFALSMNFREGGA